MKKEFFKLTLCVLVLLLSGWKLEAAPQIAPEFGPSLTWNVKGEEPSLTAMRGKSVLVFFYQDWCGICNGWSGELFQQVNESLKDDPTTVLVAIKTDGGTMAQATAYLESRMDLSNWLIAVDEGGAYCRQAIGHTKLYQYMWVRPDGTIEKIAKSGMRYTKPDKTEYVLGSKLIRQQLRKGAQAFFPKLDEMDSALKPAIKKAEQGLFLSALNLAEKSHVNREDLKSFRDSLAEKVSQMASSHEAVLSDESSKGRYMAPGKAARKALSSQAGKSWLNHEQEASKDYQAIQRRATRADDKRSRARIKRAMEKLANEFPTTYYGRLASASVK